MSRQMKVKSLSLSRKSQPTPPPKAEDAENLAITDEEKAGVSRLEVALNSPIARGNSRQCSTPIRSNGEAAEDSPDQDVGGSPISMFPCTQESMGEVLWDWSCAGDMASRNGLSNITPKRRQLVKKKRLAKGNSPLLNFPQKRKIIEPDNAERINKFAEEFKALADKIKSEQEIEAEKKIEARSALVDISDMRTQIIGESEPDIHEAETLKATKEKINASLEDLFDDSIDACLVQCSQEIEDKLRFESTEALRNSKEEEERRTGGNRDGRGSVEGKKKKQEKEKSGSEYEVPASQIPDDSLDDCLALCFDDDEDLVSKFLEPKKKKKGDEAGPSWGRKLSENMDDGGSRMKKSVETSPCFKRKQQCMSTDGLPGAQSRKFFKAKSLSDSLCASTSSEKARRSIFSSSTNSRPGCSSNPSQISKCSSNVNLSSRGRTNDVFPIEKSGNAVSSAGSRNDFPQGSTTSNKPSNGQVSYSYLKSGGSGSPVEKTTGNYDPYAILVNKAGKSMRDLRGSQLQCTPAEIEKKRAEARMKLEANRRKKQLSFNRSQVGINLSAVKRPSVKR